MVKADDDFDRILKYAESKTDEKWSVLSLDICKKELEQEYKSIKEICKYAKES